MLPDSDYPASDILEPVDYEEDPNPAYCAAQTRLGKQCMATKQRLRPYCISHDPEFRRQYLVNCREGGLNSRRRREGISRVLDVDVVDLRTRRDIQALIDTVIRLELAGQISAAHLKSLSKLLALAVHNFDKVPRADRADGDIAMHDPRYYNTRNALDLEIDGIASALAQGDQAELDRETNHRRALLQLDNELRNRPKSARKTLLDAFPDFANNG